MDKGRLEILENVLDKCIQEEVKVRSEKSSAAKKMIEKRRQIELAKIQINARPLLVLKTLALNDLSIQQVADKLFISKVTADKHLNTARKALSVRTNHAAIRRCIQLGLFSYPSLSAGNHGLPAPGAGRVAT